MTKIRTGQAPAPLTRAQFHARFNVRFYDPAFAGERDAISRLEDIDVLTARQPGARFAPLHFLSGGLFSQDIHRI
jgi:hypothetical protein